MSLFVSVRRSVVSAFAVVAGVFSAVSAWAQLPPSVVITFDSAATSVPVGGLASWGLGLAVAGLALWFARRNAAGRAALMVIAASSVIATAAFNVPSATARIVPNYPINLVTSPTSVFFGSGPLDVNQYLMEFKNTASSPITIRSVGLVNAGSLLIISAAGTTCVSNLVLAPNATCLVQLQPVAAG